MKKIALIALMFSAITISKAQLSIISPSLDVKRGQEGKFKFDSLQYNFGTIKQGEQIEHDFIFINVGKSPITITDARGSCHCTVPKWPQQPVKRNAKGVVKVHFDSTGKMGVQDKTVTVTSNAIQKTVTLHLKGNVVANENSSVK
jgi:hypothetical protein